ncbi:hypothetical protein BDZ91DRAFT_713921 [Kalaharituber pfeilii]|nr:hypothetical protein BDZ91DRAFT_713921 [Kalaharituber pfeilii]
MFILCYITCLRISKYVSCIYPVGHLMFFVFMIFHNFSHLRAVRGIVHIGGMVPVLISCSIPGNGFF